MARLLFALWMAAAAAFAADASVNPQPSPQQLLAQLAGRWIFEEQIFAANPFSKPGKRSGTFHSQPILGGYFLEGRGESAGPDGKSQAVEIIGYDAEKQRYQSTWFDSTGFFNRGWKNDHALGTVRGNIWEWVWTQEQGMLRYRCKQIVTYSADRRSFFWTTWHSVDGATWVQDTAAKGRRAD